MQIGVVLRDLFRHMEWADATVWAAVRNLGADDKRLRELLQHLHGTQRAFFDAWREKNFERGMLTEHTLAAIEQWAREYHREIRVFLDDLDDSSLDRAMRLPWADRFAKGAQPTTLGDTMIQITAHSTYHRGQVNMRMRELGGEPPLVDFIAWLWQGRPAPPW